MFFDLSTYGYCQRKETPSYEEISNVKSTPTECFNNVIYLAKFLKTKNIETEIHLTFGMRQFCECSTVGYHYILRDKNNGLFVENQYYSWVGLSVHKWDYEEYVKEKNKDCFSAYYCNEFTKSIYYSLLFTKNLHRYKFTPGMSDKDIKERVKDMKDCVAKKPKYGSEILKQIYGG